MSGAPETLGAAERRIAQEQAVAYADASGAPETLRAAERRINHEQVVAYADASGDHNPLHLDEEFAKGTSYGRPIVHGMLALSLLSEMMTAAFGGAWLRGGRLKARFRAPVFPGDAIRASGTLKRAEGGVAVYEAAVVNQDGASVITGEAAVPLNG